MSTSIGAKSQNVKYNFESLNKLKTAKNVTINYDTQSVNDDSTEDYNMKEQSQQVEPEVYGPVRNVDFKDLKNNSWVQKKVQATKS